MTLNKLWPVGAVVYSVGRLLFFSVGQGDIQHRLQFGWRERRRNQYRAIIGGKNNINAGNTGRHRANVPITFSCSEMQFKNADVRTQAFQPTLAFPPEIAAYADGNILIALTLSLSLPPNNFPNENINTHLS